MNGYAITVCGMGEALFDIFQGAQVLGGAPLNVAVHAQQLASKKNGRGVVLSRIGQDHLGEQIIENLSDMNIETQFIQSDPDHATGQVYVQIDEDGQPSYDIVANTAWDWLQYDPDMDSLAQQCDAVCFGSLAQREAQTRGTIYRFLETCRPSTIRLFDVNIRLDFYSRQIITRSVEHANALKLNEEELPLVYKLLGLGTADPENPREAMLKIMSKFQINWIAYTRGAKGTTIHTPGSPGSDHGVYVGQPAIANPVEGADAVGAGDSVAATCLVGAVLRKPWQDVADLANKVGAYVASQCGATPKLPDELIDQI